MCLSFSMSNGGSGSGREGCDTATITPGKIVKIIEFHELKHLLKFYNCVTLKDEVLNEIASTTVEIISSPPTQLSTWDGMIQIRTASQQEYILPFAALMGGDDDPQDDGIINTTGDKDDLRFYLVLPLLIPSL
jgi:hypothetical protein